MTGRSGRVVLRMGAVVLFAAGGFILLQSVARDLEARAATNVLRATGSEGVAVVSPSVIQVLPSDDRPFRAIVTPTCSSVASALAIGALATLAPAGSRRANTRRVLATAAAVFTVVAGNILRIAGSLAVGLVAGRSSLILFHDWVGSMFGFAYTLGGYILFLFLLLPKSPRPASPVLDRAFTWPQPSNSSLPAPASSSC